LYARGASDMKGQIFAHLKAMQAITKFGDPPVNIKYLLEGEEEVGSPNLAAFVRDHKDLLQYDFVLNCDAGIQGPELPGIIYGLRGLAYFELEVRGPDHDLHSGFFGGSVRNPINELCRLIAGMHDEHGRVTLPGFYDKVRPLSDDERADIAKLPHPDADHLALTGSPALWGEEGYTTIERIGARPALDANGIIGGFTGAGSKTVMPSKAMTKISMRLVPNQDDEKITELFKEHFVRIAPESVKVTVRPHHGGLPFVTDVDSDAYRAADAAMSATFGKKPIPMREGGSIPILADFNRILDMPIILMGFGLDTDALHSPNEHFGLFNFYKGIETIALYHHKFKTFKS